MKKFKNLGFILMAFSLCLFAYGQSSMANMESLSHATDTRHMDMIIGAATGAVFGGTVYAITKCTGLSIIGLTLGISGLGFISMLAGLGGLIGGSITTPEAHFGGIYTRYILAGEYVALCFLLFVLGSFINMFATAKEHANK